jgi:hypothetical protein
MVTAWRVRGIGAFLCCLIVGVVAVCAAAPDKVEKSDKLQQLFEARAKLADEAYQACIVFYQAGTITLDELLSAANDLTEAKLALCKTKAERIAIREKQIERAKDYEAQLKALADVNAKGGEANRVARAGVNRVNAEIALELERRNGTKSEKR